MNGIIKMALALIAGMLINGGVGQTARAADKATLPLVLYGKGMSQQAAWVPSGYMGDTDAIRMDDKCAENPQEGPDCLQVVFNKNDGWGGVVWQSPANDWGELPGGWDLTGAKKLTFWARGAKGGEKVKFEAGILGKDAKNPDSDKLSLGEVVLTPEWKQYEIDLTGKNLSCIKTGFMWVVGGQGAPVTFYLDEIVYQ